MFDNNEKDLFGEAGLDLGSDFTEILDGANPFADDSIDSIPAEVESVETEAAKSTPEDAQIPMPAEAPQNTNSDAAISAAEKTADKLDDVLKRGEEIANKKTALEEKQFDGVDIEALKKRQSEIVKNNSDEARKALFAKEAEIRNRKYESKFTDEIIKAKSMYEQLGEKYKTQVNRFKNLKVGDICPVCKTAVTSENIKTIAEGIKADALKLREQGQNIASALKELLEMNQKSMDKFEEFKADDLKKVSAEIKELESGDISEIAMIEDKIRLGNLSEDEYTQLQELNKQAELFAVEVNSLAAGIL